MTDRDLIMEIMNKIGKDEAKSLREKASSMTPTAIIDMERAISDWDSKKDYTNCPVGTPVFDEGQVWSLIQPHNASFYGGRPSSLRALWSLLHTKNPIKAKSWVAPFGTSGMYMKDECYLGTNGHVYQSLENNNVYDYEAYPSYWKDLGLLLDIVETQIWR